MTQIDLEDAIAPDEMTALIVPIEADPLTFFTDAALQTHYIAKVTALVDDFAADVSTRKGRDTIKSFAYRIARFKSQVDAAGLEEKKRQSETVDRIQAGRTALKAALQDLQDRARKPLTDWELAEETRINQHIADLNALRDTTTGASEANTIDLAARIAYVEAAQTGPEREEFADEFALAKAHALDCLRQALDRRTVYEAEQAELAELRALKAAKEKEDAEREAVEREKQRAAVEAERAKAMVEAQATAAKAEEEARIAREQAAAQEKELAAIKAKQAEDAAAAAEAERQAKNRSHRAQVHNGITADLMGIGASEDIAKAIVTAIAKGKINHVAITY